MARLNAIVAVLLSLCVLASSVSGKSTKVTYCDKKGNYDVKVVGVQIEPNPVARGKPATFKISATAGESITKGKVVIDVSYYGIHVHTETHDLCSETSCPISAGDFVLAHSQVLPGFTPPGSYTLKMKMTDEKSHQLTCITFPFSIGFGSESYAANSHGRIYQNFGELVSEYESGQLHPGDLKTSLAKAINTILQPVRNHLAYDAISKALLETVKGYIKESQSNSGQK